MTIAPGKIGVGYRYPPASTNPSSNRRFTARWLPQSPAVTAPSRRELWGANLSTWVCAYGKVPTVNPSVKNQRFLPAPFSKGACGQWPLTISHDSFQRFVTSLTRPVSLPSKMRNENMGTVHALTAAAHRPSSARYRRLATELIHYSLFPIH